MNTRHTPQNIVDHWLVGAKRCESPNVDDRPVGIAIDVLVIHNISLPPAEFGGGYVEKFFCNELDCSLHDYFQHLVDLKVSSHLLIDRQGETTQFVPFNRRAWHAGQSEFCGRQACNDFSIGIELEGTDELPYTSEQYQQLQYVTRALQQAYPRIVKENIVGHCDIAPGRKTDPGQSFDWQRYFAEIPEV